MTHEKSSETSGRSKYQRLVVPVVIVMVLTIYHSLTWWYVPFVSVFHSNEARFRAPELSPRNFQKYMFPIDFQNASLVFQSINNALKQKNSDLNPIGVSFFPAYVPEGTLLYHSNGDGQIPEGLEWVAMDYEFSYSFAPMFRPRKDPDDDHIGPPGAPPARRRWSGTPALLTFQVQRPLTKLIYLEGASAAKTDTGEMDTQLVLSGLPTDGRYNERELAQEICKWGKPFGLDGIVRVEIGFEIIICDFFDKLEVVGNITFSNLTDIVGLTPEYSGDDKTLEDEKSQLMDIYATMAGYDWIKAGHDVDSRERRILLDYRKYYSVLNKTYLAPDPYVRRLNNISESVKSDIFSSLEKSLETDNDPFHQTDWQMLTENIMNKFGPMLAFMNSSLTNYMNEYENNQALSTEYLATNLTYINFNLLRRYLDNGIIDKEEKYLNAIKLCTFDYVHNYFPIGSSSELSIMSSLYKVQEEISKTIFQVFGFSERILYDRYVTNDRDKLLGYHEEIVELKKQFESFLEELDWSIYYRCDRVCEWDELCYTPSWGPSPFGWGGMDRKKLGTEFDGERYRIVKEGQCISYKDILMSRNGV